MMADNASWIGWFQARKIIRRCGHLRAIQLSVGGI